MARTLLIPGVNGSGPGHWQRWWLANDPDAHFVRQDDWDRPRLSAWLSVVRKEIAAAPGSLIVAHSLGCLLVPHLRAEDGRNVGAALLVAPADVEDATWTQPTIAAFGPVPLRELPFPSIVVASRNDPYVSFSRAREFADAWGGQLFDAGYAGHINVQSGHGAWAEGLALGRSLKRAPAAADPASAA
jgi:predicted alpha/beta hydrolase family esterase